MTVGFDFMVDVVAALAEEPRTAKVLHTDMGEPVVILPLRRLLRHMLDARVLHIHGWTEGKNPERIYGVGDKPDAPRPDSKRQNGVARVERTPARSTAASVFVTRFCRLWHALEHPSSAYVLVEESGMTLGAVRKVLRRMKARKLVGIPAYDQPVGVASATSLWKRGARNKKRERISEHESYRRQVEKRKARELHQFFTFSVPLPAQEPSSWSMQ